MPRIFDNIVLQLLPPLRQALEVSDRTDFCVGCLNLRGWRQLTSYFQRWTRGEGHRCRTLLIWTAA
jgi:hypothetical protein